MYAPNRDESHPNQHFHDQFSHVEAQSSGDIQGLVAVMDLVENPQGINVVGREMPNIHCKVQHQEGDEIFERAIFKIS